jgi:[ribosomal protein S18]-alanine N-acetyltransferase
MELIKANINHVDEIVSLDNKYFLAPWNKEQFIYEIEENQFSSTYVLINDNKVIGFIIYWILFDQGELVKICVDEKYQKQGLAQKMLDQMTNDFKKAECFVCTLEVRKSNSKAISLYEKYGFEYVLTKKAYYSNGEDALYMMKGV